MAKEGVGWLSRGWVAKWGDGWLSRGMDGQVAGWVAKLVAHPLATTALWVQIHTKIQKGDISKGVGNTL